jgi:hypothetical protein
MFRMNLPSIKITSLGISDYSMIKLFYIYKNIKFDKNINILKTINMLIVQTNVETHTLLNICIDPYLRNALHSFLSLII